MSAKPKQEALDFGRLYTVTDAARALYRGLNDAVDQVGILPAAGACGIDRADLRRALDRDSRRVGVEHAMSIASMAGSDVRRRIADAFVQPLGLTVGDALPPMTDKERADRAEAALLALGPIGQQAYAAAMGGRRSSMASSRTSIPAGRPIRSWASICCS